MKKFIVKDEFWKIFPEAAIAVLTAVGRPGTVSIVIPPSGSVLYPVSGKGG